MIDVDACHLSRNLVRPNGLHSPSGPGILKDIGDKDTDERPGQGEVIVERWAGLLAEDHKFGCKQAVVAPQKANSNCAEGNKDRKAEGRGSESQDPDITPEEEDVLAVETDEEVEPAQEEDTVEVGAQVEAPSEGSVAAQPEATGPTQGPNGGSGETDSGDA